MKKILISVCLLFMVGTINAQSVKLEGKTFTEQKKETKKEKDYTETGYTYKTKDGQTYPIYLSKKGKAFIIRVSKKTGKEYRQYLPEVTEQLKG